MPNPSIEDVLAADQVDTLHLEETIREVLSGVDKLVALKVLNKLSVEKAREIHGITLKVIVEPE